MNAFKVTVPASSGNVGPGFDSVGLALSMSLTLEVTPSEEWMFISPSITEDIDYEDHFIYQIITKVADLHGKTIPPLFVKETSSIPLARGLGSSASAIVAAIEIVNQIGRLDLTSEEKLTIGTEIEGHPDNVAPALYGGLVISTLIDGTIDVIQMVDLGVSLVACIPEVELKTEAARSVLPEAYSRQHAALASGVSNLAIAALLSGDMKLAGKMMERDLFHEPYRKKLIPNYDFIKSTAKENGAYGTIISGAGPTMLSFTPAHTADSVAEAFRNELPDYRIERLEIDKQGLRVDTL